MKTPPKLEFECGDTSLTPRRIMATERLADLFMVRVLARSLDENLDLTKFVGKGAGVGGDTESGLLGWTGICSRMTCLESLGRNMGLSTYSIEIVPSMWLLSQRRGTRVFQHLSTLDIVKKVLKEYSIEPKVELKEEHPVHEYRVQYGETDLDFVNRLLQEAGISYYFRKNRQGDVLKTDLVLCDQPHKNPKVATITFHDEMKLGAANDYVTEVRLSHDVKPGKATERDFAFRRPMTRIMDSSELKLEKGADLEKSYEQYFYLPGGSLIDDPQASDVLPVADDKSTARHNQDENKARAQRLGEAARVLKRRVDLRTNHADVNVGNLFDIERHPHPELEGSDLLVVEAHYRIYEGDWEIEATCAFAEAPYRPPLRTVKPRIRGIQTAIVVGPPGEEIYTDEFGRVRVRMHWDREAKFDDNATCWLRVSQGWAGTSFGALHIPRVGQEVIVDFLDGDPDQPLVTGRVFDVTNPLPRKLPDHKTQSIWRSASSPQTDGYFNEIMMDDAAGEELMFVQAQRDMLRLVKRNETERTGEDRTEIVGEARVSAIAHSDALHVGKQHLVQMVNVDDIGIEKLEDPKVSPKETFIEMMDEKITLTTGDATIVLDGPNINVDAKGGLRFTTDGRMVIKGSMVLFNVSGGGVSVDAEEKVEDEVARPDRMIDSVQHLFWQPEQAETLALAAQTVTLNPEPMVEKIAQADNPKAAEIAAELEAAREEMAWLLAETAADAAGLIDPTPFSDLAAAGLAVRRGDFLGAGLSILGVIPYIGDAAGKGVKGARAAARIAEVQQKIDKLSDAARALDKVDDAADAAKAAGSVSDAAKHMVTDPPKINSRKRGVHGGHDNDAFRKFLDGPPPEGKITPGSEKPVPGMDGMSSVKYRLFKSDRTGKLTDELGATEFDQLLIDGNKWSPEDVSKLGDDLFGGIAENGTHSKVVDGVEWTGHVRDGTLQTFYPNVK